MKKLLRRMNQVGGTLVECSLLTGLIAVVTIVALQSVGNAAARHFDDVALALGSSTGPGGNPNQGVNGD